MSVLKRGLKILKPSFPKKPFFYPIIKKEISLFKKGKEYSSILRKKEAPI